VNGITEAVKTWDADFRGILSAEVDKLQAGFREFLAPLCRAETPGGTSSPTQKPTPVPGRDAKEGQSLQVSSKYDPLYELGRVRNYVQQVEYKLKQNQERLETLERDWQQARSALGVARRDTEEARRQTAVEHDSATRLARAKHDLQGEISQNQIQEMMASHGEQRDTLSERIACEGEHRLDAFRNRLGTRIQTYADGLKDATDMEMTADLGTALRSQMRQLLRLLKIEGVKINGTL
jgi:chromosome segregation ATPase